MNFFTNTRTRERAAAQQIISDLQRDLNNVLIIHYSCESLNNANSTPRITAICVKLKISNASTCFSIQTQAQILRLNTSLLTEQELDLCEKRMLKDFYSFVKKHKTKKWVHWNMRSSNYGFEAIANRYRILGGNHVEIEHKFRFDLNGLLHDLYTSSFEKDAPNGKLLNMADSNRISNKDVLTGKEEALAFSDRNFQKLSLSTDRKVQIIDSIFDKVCNSQLKVKTKKYKIYGLSVSGIREMVLNNVWLSWLLALILFLAGVLLEDPIKSVFQ